jgi:hypothetical protein
MATIWTESQPPAFNEHGFTLKRKTTIVNWWWGLYLFNAVVSWFTRVDARSFSQLGSQISVQIFFDLVRLMAGVLFLVMVRATQSRQDEQWLDLERRRAVPQPDANLLR